MVYLLDDLVYSAVPQNQQQKLSDLAPRAGSVHISGGNQNITVVVSGSSFCIVPSLYAKIEKLPWKNRRGVDQLDTHADVFEHLLQFLMFGTLPDQTAATALTSKQAAELFRLTQALENVSKLENHLKALFAEEKGKKRASSLFRRRLPTISIKSHASREESSMSSAKENDAPNDDALQEHPFIVPVFSKEYDAHDEENVGRSDQEVDDFLPSLEVSNSSDSAAASMLTDDSGIANSTVSSRVDNYTPLTTLSQIRSSKIKAVNPFDVLLLSSSPVKNSANTKNTPSPIPQKHKEELSNSVSSHRKAASAARKAILKFRRGTGPRTHAEWCNASQFIV